MRERREGTTVAGVLLLGTVAALVFTWPLPRLATTAIPYAVAASPERSVVGLVPGDHLQFHYFLMVARDMVRGEVAPFTDPYEFSAPEPSRRRTFFFLPFSLLFAMMAGLGDATAYNVLVWLSFPATTIATYALARSIGVARAGAILAGMAATLLPYRVANVAGGHPSGFVFFILPLVLWLTDRAWRRSSPLAAAAAGLAAIVLALNEPHYLYFLSFLLPLWMLFASWGAWGGARAPATTPMIAVILAVAAAGPGTACIAYLTRSGELHVGAVPLVLLASFGSVWGIWRGSATVGGADGRDHAFRLLPLAALGLYPLQAALEVPYGGRVLALAVTAALLAANTPMFRRIATFASRDAASSPARFAALWPLAAGLLIAFAFVWQFKSAIDASASATGRTTTEVALFSARPADFLSRHETRLPRMLYPGIVPVVLGLGALATAHGRALALGAVGFGILSLGLGAPGWLPFYRVAFDVVPYFAFIRQPAKLSVVAFLCLALAAGFGTGWLRERLGARGGVALVTAAVVAMAVDFAAVLPLGLSVLPRENRVYETIASRAGETNLLELPIWPGDSAFSSIYQYWSTRTKVPTVNGYSPTAPRDYVTRVARPLGGMNLGEMTPLHDRVLDDARVSLLTLHRDTFPPQVSAYPYRFTLAAMRRNPNLEFLLEDDGVYLFARRGGEYLPWDGRIGWPIGVFYEAETLRIRAGLGRSVSEKEASGGKSVVGRSGVEESVFLHGPYRPFPPGTYRARFRARGRGHVEVSTDRGARVLARREVRSDAYEEVVVSFEIAETTTLELRGDAGGEMAIDWVLVEKDDPMPAVVPGRVEAEDLLARSGSAREESTASGGAVAVLVPSAAPEGRVVLDGPYRPFGPGEFVVRVRARNGRFRLRVESADGRTELAEIAVRARRRWRVAEERFRLPRGEIVATRVVSEGMPAEIDYVEIVPETATSAR